MTRLVRPLVYILGFSVYCACTTTRMSRVEDLKPSNSPRNLQITLTDGTQLRLRSATISETVIQGLIVPSDTAVVSQKSAMDIVIASLPKSATGMQLYLITIPRFDAALVHIKEPDNLSAAIGFTLIVAAFVSVGLLVGPITVCCG